MTHLLKRAVRMVQARGAFRHPQCARSAMRCARKAKTQEILVFYIDPLTNFGGPSFYLHVSKTRPPMGPYQ